MTSFSWATNTSGDWNVGTLWAGGTVPNDVAADVTIDAATTLTPYTVTIAPGETETVNSLSMNATNNLGGTNNPAGYYAAELDLDGTLIFGPTSSGALDGSLQTFLHVDGGENASIVNAGTINGFLQVEGNLLLTGTNGLYITNDLQALAGTVTIDTSSIAEMTGTAATGNTLFDGIFEAKGPGAVINMGGTLGNNVVNIATIEGPPLNPGGWTELTFNDPTAAINEWNGTNYVSVENSLTDIMGAGTVDVLAGRDYTTGNTLSVDAGVGPIVSGMLNLQAGTVTTAGLDINGGIVQGSATIVGGVVNDGTLIAEGGTAVGTLDLTGGLTGTGVVDFDFDNQAGTVDSVAATLVVNSVSAGQTIVMNGGDTLQLNALSNFAGTIQAGALGGVSASSALMNAGTLVMSDGAQTVATLALSGTAAADPVTLTGSYVSVGTAPTVAPGAPSNDLNIYGSGETASLVRAGNTIVSSGSSDVITLQGSADAASLTGDLNTVTLTGTNTVADAIGGGNTISAGAGDLVSVSATSGVNDQVNASGVQTGVMESNGQSSGIDVADTAEVGVTGANNFVTLGTNDVLGAIGGGGNTITAVTGDFVYISGTGGTSDQVNATGDQAGFIHSDGLGSGIQMAASAETGVTGSNNFVVLGTNDVLGVIGGGGNTVNAGAGDFVYISGTGGTSDQINAIGDQAGFMHVGGLGSGIDVAANAEAGVTGGGNFVLLGTNDVLGAIGGGGNTISAGVGDFVYISGTGGTSDQVNATGDQSGVLHGVFGSGIQVAASANAGVTGANNFITLGASDVLGAIGGGGNTINAGAGDFVYIAGTNGTSDQVNATGDQSGVMHSDNLGSGIQIAANAEAGVTGSDNFITLGTGDVLGVIGGGGSTINAGAGDFVYIAGTNGSSDQVNADGDQSGVSHSDGQGSGIQLADNAQVNVTGSNNSIVLGSGDTAAFIGTAETVTATNDTVNLTNGSSATVTGSNDTVNLAANGELVLGNSGGIGFITGSTGTNQVLANAGSQTVSGFSTGHGDQIDLRQILNGASLAHDLSNLGNYVSVSDSGSNTTLAITGPHASDSVTLTGVGALSLQTLINTNAFALPPH